MSVLQMIVADMVPATSLAVPLIGWYCTRDLVHNGTTRK